MLESWHASVLLALLLILVVLVVYLCVDWLLHRSLLPAGPVGRWVLITGCDTGFGNQTAQRLDSVGCRVIAGCLTSEGCSALAEDCSSRLVPVILDVTNEECVQRVFQTVSDLLGPDQELWGVVNNAGILGGLGPLEWLKQEDFVGIVEVNVLGMVRVIRTFLPLLKRSRRGGRIVNTSSILGKLSIPYAAPYCMTKYAVEAFSDALRVELHPYDIRVSIIEPGGHSTKFLEGISSSTMTTWKRLPDAVQQTFGEAYLKQVMFLGAKLIPFISSSSLDGVVAAYEHALFATIPRRRYLVGWDAIFLSISSFIPSAILDFLFNLPGLRAVPASCRKMN